MKVNFDGLIDFIFARIHEEVQEVDAVWHAARLRHVWAEGWDAERVHRANAEHVAFSHMINLYYRAKALDDPNHVADPRQRSRPSVARGTLPAWEQVLVMVANIWADHPDFKKPDWQY